VRLNAALDLSRSKPESLPENAMSLRWLLDSSIRILVSRAADFAQVGSVLSRVFSGTMVSPSRLHEQIPAFELTTSVHGGFHAGIVPDTPDEALALREP
jgi:hypothetical protein